MPSIARRARPRRRPEDTDESLVIDMDAIAASREKSSETASRRKRQESISPPPPDITIENCVSQASRYFTEIFTNPLMNVTPEAAAREALRLLWTRQVFNDLDDKIKSATESAIIDKYSKLSVNDEMRTHFVENFPGQPRFSVEKCLDLLHIQLRFNYDSNFEEYLDLSSDVSEWHNITKRKLDIWYIEAASKFVSWLHLNNTGSIVFPQNIPKLNVSFEEWRKSCLAIAKDVIVYPFREFLDRYQVSEDFAENEKLNDRHCPFDSISEDWGFECDPKDMHYYNHALRNLMIAAIRRSRNTDIENPVKFHYITIIQGPQGCGKDTWWESLCPSLHYYTDDIGFNQKKIENQRKYRLALFANFSECTGLKFRNMANLKQEITQSMDQVRDLYENQEKPRLRRTIFVGTSNEPNLLPSDAEHRRFIIIQVKGDSIETPKRNAEYLAQNKERLWKWAYWYAVHTDVPHYFDSNHLVEYQREHNKEFIEFDDTMFNKILLYFLRLFVWKETHDLYTPKKEFPYGALLERKKLYMAIEQREDISANSMVGREISGILKNNFDVTTKTIDNKRFLFINNATIERLRAIAEDHPEHPKRGYHVGTSLNDYIDR